MHQIQIANRIWYTLTRNFQTLTCAALIVDVGPPDGAVAVLGAGGGPLRAAVAEDGPADARVAVWISELRD